VNNSWQNTRRLRWQKPEDWRNRSRTLFRFMLRDEVSCRTFHRMAPTEITSRKRLLQAESMESVMNANNRQAQAPTFRELYGPKRSSVPWEEQQVDIVRFWTDSGDCWGFLFHHLTGTYYSARYQRLLIDWALGTIVVTAPGNRTEKKSITPMKNDCGSNFIARRMGGLLASLWYLSRSIPFRPLASQTPMSD
jgi:hypothetical protein